VVEQKAESNGRSERRVRKVVEEHIVVCGMQLEMVAGEKSRDAVKGCWRKHAEMACNCSDVNCPTPGIVKRCAKLSDGVLDDSRKVEFSEREAEDNTPAKLAGETGVVQCSEAMPYALGGKVRLEKWGTSDVAVPDTVGRAVGQALVQITGETRGWSRVDTEDSLEKVRVAEES